MADLGTIKDRLHDLVDAHAAVLIDTSHSIHEHPELAFEEHHAHDLLTGILEGEGLAVERSAYGLETGFAARAGSCRADDRRAVRVRRPAGHRPRLRPQHHRHRRARRGPRRRGARRGGSAAGCCILGTPAEEGGGGKVFMAEQGALEGVDAAMMVHPAGAGPAT